MATKTLLCTPQIIPTNIYESFNLAPKNTEHAIRTCSVAANFWNQLVIDKENTCLRNLPFQDWLKQGCNLNNPSHKHKVRWGTIFAYGCWHIWRARNQTFFQPNTPVRPLLPPPPCKLLCWQRQSMRPLGLWQPPSHKDPLGSFTGCHSLQNWVKLNSDGSTRGNLRQRGVGDVIRNNKGEWLAGYQTYLGKTTNILTELWVLRDGLLLATKIGISHIEVEKF